MHRGDTVQRVAWGFMGCMGPVFMGVQGGFRVTNETVVHGVNGTLVYSVCSIYLFLCAVFCAQG